MKNTPRFSKVENWLTWLENLHPKKIDLTLDRAKKVISKLNLDKKKFPSIVVAGTNGKGSSVAFLESIYYESGYKVGSFTSPHLISFNERIKFNQEQITDIDLVNIFQLIDRRREDISLSYFEYSFIAALCYFHTKSVDIGLFEVGLGGRLDVVNSIDHDLSLITSISLDHQSWLGDNRDSIGLEKAGVMRKKQPSVISDRDPPKSILDFSHDIGSIIYKIGNDFDFVAKDNEWDYFSPGCDIYSLNFPSFGGNVQLNNASGAIKSTQILTSSLPVDSINIKKGITKAQIKGRIDRHNISGIEWLFDVAHNPASTKILAEELEFISKKGKIIAIFSMMKDKDIEQSVTYLAPYIDEWHIAPLDGDRGTSSQDIVKTISKKGVFLDTLFLCHDTIDLAYSSVITSARKDDLVVVFGSFRIVSPVMHLLGL